MMLPCFIAAALFGLAGLCTVARRETPVITWTAAVICTLAAIAMAIPH
ncbi:hypothetical protein ACIBKZ_22505 [Streptomyces sp. NPDC050421]